MELILLITYLVIQINDDDDILFFLNNFNCSSLSSWLSLTKTCQCHYSLLSISFMSIVSCNLMWLLPLSVVVAPSGERLRGGSRYSVFAV